MLNKQNLSLTLGYWKLRGLAQPIRYLLHYVGVPYREEFYEFGDAPEWSRDAWLTNKDELDLDFPNLPYLIERIGDDGSELRLTQSRTILRHLGRRFGLVGSTPAQISNCEMLLDQLHDLRMDFNIVCYNQPNNEDFKATRRAFCSKILPGYLGKFERFLKKWPRRWLVGDDITVADFQFFEYLDHCWLMCDIDDKWDRYTLVRALMKKVRDLPELKDYFESEIFKNLPINAKMARFGGEVITRMETKAEV